MRNSLVLMLCFLCSASAIAIENKNYSPYPQPDSGYVTDYASLLSRGEQEKLERWLNHVESQSQVEIIVFTINSIQDYPDTANTSIEAFATELFDAYGIGNLPQNNGVLLLVSREDRKARIELGAGYGRTRDADARRIMDTKIIPQFKKNDYAGGLTQGTKAIIAEFADMRVGFPSEIVFVCVVVVACALVGMSLVKNGKRGWGYVFYGLALILILLVIYIVINFLRKAAEGQVSDSGSWGSGGGFGGSSGGGFGGGSSGGGGATGSW